MRIQHVVLAALIISVPAAAHLVVNAPSAHAAPCGDGTLAFSGGDGSESSPFLITTEADLVALRDGYGTTPSYYSCAYRQASDITLATSWPHGIGFSTPGSALYKPFQGIYDGDGHSLTNLVIDASAVARPNQARELGFVGLSTSSSAVVRNLNLVNAAITCGFEAVDAAMLVAQISGSVVRSSASGTVDCLAADALARLGGLVGYTNGAVANSWASGTVTAPTVSTFLPNALGGAVGRADTSASIENVLERVTVVNPGSGVWAGVFIGWLDGTVLASYGQSGLTGGGTGIVGRGVAAGIGLKTAAELQDIATYVGWSISAGVSTATIWGITPGINGGFPFLQSPDRAVQAPPPILQQLPALGDGLCGIQDDAAYGYGTSVHGGWGASWAQWANGGTGGPVCTRTLVYVNGGWTLAM